MSMRALPPFGTAMNLLNFSGRPSLPMIRQSEAAECGLACLAMIAAHHGHRTTLGLLRRRSPVAMTGLSLADLIEMAEALGFAGRPLRAEPDEADAMRLPAVLHWDLTHFVVLKAVRHTLRGKRFVVHDPARGVIEIGLAELSRHWTGVALELTPTAVLTRLDQRPRLRLSQLGTNLFGLTPALAQALALSLVLQLFAFAGPFYLQLAIDKAVPSLDTIFLGALAIGFAGMALIGIATRGVRDLILLRVGSAAGFSMVADLFRHLLRLPLGFFERRHTGDILSRLGSSEAITNLLSHGLIAGMIDAGMALLTLAMMVYYSPQLAALAVAALAIFVTARLATVRRLQRLTADAVAAKADEASTTIETVRGIATIKLFGRGGDRLRLWQNRRADAINADLKLQRMTIWFELLGDGVSRIENVLFVFLAVSMVIGGTFTIGMIFAFLAYKTQFLEAGLRFADLVADLRALDTHVDRLADIALEAPEETGGPRRAGEAPCSGRIEMRDVRFAYGGNAPEVLRGVNLTIAPGESIAITGASGCGKSTLAKLLLGFHAPTSGDILIDGEALRQHGIDRFRRQLGVVQQSDVLYAGTIAENIGFFDPHLDDEQVRRCARIACIDGDIARLPMGYDSLVGDMGSTLSGGQRQRLFLARALYRRPRILVLDEGTANLDTACEAAVNANLAALAVTRIVIAHRPETIASAQRVVRLNAGVIEELAPVAAVRMDRFSA